MNVRQKTIYIIAPDLEYFTASICSGLYHELAHRGYQFHIRLTCENEEKEKEYIEEVIKQKEVTGLVIFSCLSSSLFYQRVLSENVDIPCVFVDRLLFYLSYCNFVTVDNYGGAYKLGKLLIEKGAQHIVCLSMLKNNKLSTIEDRLNGFRDSHINNNNVLCHREELEYSDVAKSVETLLKNWEKRGIFPDAIFATNHLIINAFITYIQKNKQWHQLSENMILSCFDNLPYFDWINRPVISVEQPIKDIVFYVSNILLKSIEQQSKNTSYANIILPVKIIDRTVKI